jgi:hypothetical protein
VSWFKKPLNIGIAIGAGVLAVVAAVLVIYGVVTHSEPVLLQVCWHNGIAFYDDGSVEEGGVETNHEPCDRPEELVWPTSQLPLTVAASTPDGILLAPGASQREGVDAAIRDINSQIGFTLFAPIDFGARASVVVQVGAAMDSDRVRGVREVHGRGSRPSLGYAAHHRANGEIGVSLHCDITVYSSTGNLRGDYLVAHHELLHCAGLAHDPDNPASAIYPFTVDDTMWELMQAARITDADRARLRELYRR